MGNELALPWERQSQVKEPWAAFSAFCIYRDLEPHEKKLTTVSAKSKRSLSTIQRWNKQYHWEDRLTALIDHEERIKFDMARKEKEAMCRLQATSAREIYDKAMRVLRNFNEDDISVRDALAMQEAAFKQERLVRGEVTENTKTEHNVIVQNNTQNIISSPEAALKVADLFDIVAEDKLQIKNA